jgi:hypothetical protein
VEKRANKKQKEKKSRMQESRVTQTCEDFLQNYLALTFKNQQTAGNGNEAGLEGVKIENHRMMLALLQTLLHRGFVEALQQDRVAEWRREIVEISTSWQGHDDLTAGTFLADPEGKGYEVCDHDRGQRRCTVHGTPDHVRCRKDRLRQNFKTNLEQWHEKNPGCRDSKL